jgi:hypothetical protein
MKLIFTLILSLTAFVASAQQGERYLVLNKPGQIKRIRFVEGSTLDFTLQGDKHRYEAIITSIHPDALLFGDVYVPLKDIKSIRYQKNTYLANMVRISSITAVNAGLTIAGLGVARGTIAVTFNDEPMHVGQFANSLTLGGLWMAGSGMLMKPLYRRNYKIGRKRWLDTIEFPHPPQHGAVYKP